MRAILYLLLLLVALTPAAYASKADDETLATSCAELADRPAADCQEMMSYLRDIARNSQTSGYSGPKLGAMEECAAVVIAATLEEDSLRRCIWQAYSGRAEHNLLKRGVFKDGYPGFGAALSDKKSCADTLEFLGRLGSIGIAGTKSNLAADELTCVSLVRMARDWGAEPTWANCAANTNPLSIFFDCTDRTGSDLSETLMGWVTRCKGGRGSEQAYWIIKRQAEVNGRPLEMFDCDYVFDVAAYGGYMTEREAALSKVALADFMVEVAEAQVAREEAARKRDAQEAIDNPDTYGKLVAPGQPDSLLRNIEVGRDYHAVSGGNALFTSGLVDALAGNCPIALNPTQRAVLVNFIANATMAGRNAFGGDLDGIAANVNRSMNIIGEGHAAAARLRCEEPVSSKLVYNVLRLLGHG